MQAFQYASPSALKEALALLSGEWGRTEVLAGGTDLLALMKDDIATPERVVNIKGIKELDGIRKTRYGLRIGAMVTLDQLIANPLVRAEYPALIMAAEGVASPQVRNLGTVGGDLCQRPRCWYFRSGHGLLALGQDGRSLVPDGENRYHAILGNAGPAYFVSASSLGPPLIALNAKVRLASLSGKRELEVAKFFVVPVQSGDRETVLRPNEIVTEILIPPSGGARNATYEVRQKQALDWPLATASVSLLFRDDLIDTARVVLGHVAPTPWFAQDTNNFLRGKLLTEEVADHAAWAALMDATPLSQNTYKIQLARTAVRRALLEARGKG